MHLATLLCFTSSLYALTVSSTQVIPSGNVSVCPGRQGSIQCMTTVGPLLWTSGSLNRLFNTVQPPTLLGNLTLSVISVMVEGSTIRVTSNATISYFHLSDSILLLKCRDITTGFSKNATFIPAGPPSAPNMSVITQSSTNSSSLLISWSMSGSMWSLSSTPLMAVSTSTSPLVTPTLQ